MASWDHIELFSASHDNVIKWKHFPRYWRFGRGIHRWSVNSSHKGQWRGALMFSLICAWINGWVNNREAGDLRRHRAHFDFVNSSPPCAAYLRQWTGSALAQVMTCRLFGAKPLPEPLVVYCKLDSWEQISVKFEMEFYYFHSRKCIRNCLPS